MFKLFAEYNAENALKDKNIDQKIQSLLRTFVDCGLLIY